MPGTTPCVALPYPTDTDPIDVAGNIASLALAADSAICGIATVPLGVFMPWWDNGGDPPSGTLRCDGSTFDPAVYPDLNTHLGGNTLPDMRGRFIRGTDETGGAFPGNGQTGGWADAVVAAHTHTTDAHSHGINHTHPDFTATGGSHLHSMSHQHAGASTNATGQHQHQERGTNNAPVDSGAPQFGQNAWADWTFTSFPVRGVGGPAGSHSHTVSIPNYTGNTGTSSSHSHAIAVPAFTGTSGSASPSTNSAGSPATNRNVPPFMNATWIIQAKIGSGD